ncbi:phosphate ABC transporter permease subunit PstC [Rhodococcus hoagii]|uniref:Phosphate transport system permease protein n=4 Tax=Rhodococcus hoagii TaxID=43767 RepID=E9T0R7_RHOHA|nr:phosphate ABC transporter permease subunit PstC [Prescottella equi]MBU4613374.1 phosphate ABC transporter permease subunit PstC [Rhodococcus sp. GG48]MCD7051282.1 phosphate ABC transporter permease subunit PstC [Rhodococcus sp. BH2-1]GBF14432.1 phosphate transport system permease protein PstC [Rhodococcus sp. Br-6]AVP67279.1 phosphate ABC transporter permease subunit PstC [Prescottella equi]EGD24018.1 phosphate ABC transporter, permease protein PstC [Prescottella equi ATCC 33707]
MTDASTRSTPRASDPADGGAGVGGPHGNPEAPITTPQATKNKTVTRPGDRIFGSLASGSAVFITLLVAAVGIFLIWRAVPALQRNEVNFLTSRVWDTDNINAMAFGVLDLLLVTVMVSVFALVLAMPVALGIAIFLTEYAPKKLSRPLAYVIDLLAAVPSIVYGLWGLLVFAPAIAPLAVWLNEHLGWIPIFADGSGSIRGGGTIFTAGIVLAVMILPVITAVTREVFAQTPKAHVEAALALGATRWEVVRTTVIPFGKSGYISGSMLGLGRALGETMALYMILRTTSQAFSGSLFDSGSTIASKIALGYAEFNNNIQAGAYIAAGLVLFVLTFVVNAAARAAIAGKRD